MAVHALILLGLGKIAAVAALVKVNKRSKDRDNKDKNSASRNEQSTAEAAAAERS